MYIHVQCVSACVKKKSLSCVPELIYILQVAAEVAKVKGVKKVILADNEAYKGFLPGLLKVSLSLQKEIVCFQD